MGDAPRASLLMRAEHGETETKTKTETETKNLRDREQKLRNIERD